MAETATEKGLIPESRVKDFAKTLDMRFSGEALPVLDAAVKALIQKAGARAKENGRGTIQPQDL